MPDSSIKALLVETDGSVKSISLPRDPELRTTALFNYFGAETELLTLLKEEQTVGTMIAIANAHESGLPWNELADGLLNRNVLMPEDIHYGAVVIVGIEGDGSVSPELEAQIFEMSRQYREPPETSRGLES